MAFDIKFLQNLSHLFADHFHLGLRSCSSCFLDFFYAVPGHLNVSEGKHRLRDVGKDARKGVKVGLKRLFLNEVARFQVNNVESCTLNVPGPSQHLDSNSEDKWKEILLFKIPKVLPFKKAQQASRFTWPSYRAKVWQQVDNGRQVWVIKSKGGWLHLPAVVREGGGSGAWERYDSPVECYIYICTKSSIFSWETCSCVTN